MTKYLRWIYLILISFWFSWAQAQINEVDEFYTGARALGMGGASIATVNDETALLVNPSGLGKLRDSFGTVLDPELHLGTSFLGLNLKAPNSDLFNPQKAYNQLSALPDNYSHTKFQVFPSYVVRNFGIGILGHYQLDAKISPDSTELYTRYRSDYALMLGYNLRLWGGRIKIGFVGKAINRVEIKKNLLVSGDLTVPTNASEGVGVGGDVGLTLTAPWVWLPTISAVARDVGGTKFESGAGLRMNTATRPEKVEQDIDVAVALFPIHSSTARSSFTIEYRKMTEASRAKDKLRYTHVGYEYNFGDVIFLRMGMNQRYWTAGIEFATQYFQFQAASYGEDVGPDGSPEESRRLVGKFAFRF